MVGGDLRESIQKPEEIGIYADFALAIDDCCSNLLKRTEGINELTHCRDVEFTLHWIFDLEAFSMDAVLLVINNYFLVVWQDEFTAVTKFLLS